MKLAGDAVYGQDRWLPQISAGLMYKKNNGIDGLGALGITNVKQLGATNDHGTDFYLSATKILLEHSLLLNGTIRATKANQMGILGFGSDRNDPYKPMFETSIAYLINRKLAAGAEYRRKPNNLSVDREKDYYDLFVAYFPNKNLSVTAAYVDMERLAQMLAEQFCEVSGGPCKYSGKDMKEIHADLHITNSQFNALAEDLQSAMEKQGVPSTAQNKLIAKLAPMQRQVVTR